MDIEALEKIQRRTSIISNELYGQDYKERIKAWGILKLFDRRVRGKIIQMHKVLNILEEINWYKGPNQATNPH